LAVQGSGEDFKRQWWTSTRLTRQMPDNGLQLVQFTHQNPAVWGDLGMILWASGLKVTAAWTISTETAAGGIKKGNYVQGTVNLVLRKRTEERSAWLDEIYPADRGRGEAAARQHDRAGRRLRAQLRRHRLSARRLRGRCGC
jgi:putative DNA methylase